MRANTPSQSLGDTACHIEYSRYLFAKLDWTEFYPHMPKTWLFSKVYFGYDLYMKYILQ